MGTEFDINYLINQFQFEGSFKGYRCKDEGHINTTYVLIFDDGKQEYKYTLQKINTYVFKNPDELMGNIVSVTSHLKKKAGRDSDRCTLDMLRAKNGKYYCTDPAGNCWRCYRYIDGVYTCNTIESPDVFYNAGKSFGNFQRMLADYPIEKLYETIPKFHDTYSRFCDFLQSVKDDTKSRAREVGEEINFVIEHEKDTKILLDMLQRNELPLRVTHNDTKLNNILFDNDTNEGICIIDLDTVMPGLSLYDFGDSIRFGANTAGEDEQDLSKVSLSLELFEAYTKGYLCTARESLTENEIAYLPFSAKLMTFECGMRFLTDYLNGDVYFKTDYPEHNLVRCRTQFKLVSDIELKFDKMQKITAEAAAI